MPTIRLTEIGPIEIGLINASPFVVTYPVFLDVQASQAVPLVVRFRGRTPMRRSFIRSVGPGMALLALGLLGSAVVELGSSPGLADKPSSAAKTPAANKPQVVETFGKLPLYFIENQGQLDPRVAYYIQGGDKSIYFTGRGVTFALTDALTGAGEGKPSSEALVHPVSYRGDRRRQGRRSAKGSGAMGGQAGLRRCQPQRAARGAGADHCRHQLL